MAHALIVLCPLGLAAEADRAERARTTGDDAQLADARSVGLALLQEARAAASGVGDFGALAQVATLKASLAMAEAEWTRLEGRSDPEAWQAAVEAFSYGAVYQEACCRWRLAEALLGTGQRD